MTRFRTLTAFAALIALTSFLVACGGGSSSSDPKTIVDEATLQGIESGKLDLSLGVDVKGEGGGHVDVSLSGPFQREGEEELPELDLSAKAKGSIGGEAVDFEGGLALLPSKAFVEYSGTQYEVDQTTFNFVKSAIEKQTKAAGGESGEGSGGCQEVVADLKLGDFLEGLKEEGSADVGGTSTTKVSGKLDASGAIELLQEVIEDPACGAQLSAAGPLPSGAELEKAEGEVEEALKEANVTLYVGDDHIVRRIVADAEIEPPKGGGKGGPQSVALEFDLQLTGVNEGQTISAPQHAKPLSDLFIKLGVNPIELAGALSEGGGLGGLLEGLNGGTSGGGGPSGGGGGASAGGQQAYLDCIKEAQTAADIQKCAGLLQ